MISYVQDTDFTLYEGDARHVLAKLPAESVDCCVTSPPYWGLRDYGTDGQIGLEASPEEFVAEMVAVFRQVRRVLAPHGTLWLNLGDSYASSPPGNKGSGLEKWKSSGLHGAVTSERYAATLDASVSMKRNTVVGDLKPKDLVGIPWRVAFALQQPYYTGRIAAERDRVWLAAILDGEGTICGMRHVRPGGNVRTGCMTFITNTSEALLDECDRIWRGSRYSEKVTSEVARPCWRWELQSAADRSAFVRELYPYLIEKKQQALVAWNLLEIVQDAKRLGRGGESTATKEKRDHLVRLLGDLNQRRPADLPSWLKVPLSLHEQGWYLRMDNIWAKNNPMPESVTDRPTKAHEYVFLLSKSRVYRYDAAAIAEPATWDRWGAQTMRKEVVGKATLAKRNEKADVPVKDMRNARSVWRGNCAQFPGDHPAVMPDWLAARCILAGCPSAGLVLDPFAGAGTTALVARRLGRRSIGIELSEKSCAIAAERLAQLPLVPEIVA